MRRDPMASLSGRFGRGWRVAASVVFLTVVIFGALSQGGFLTPRFRDSGGGVAGGSITNSIQNVSWRSWTVTGVHLANKESTLRLRDLRIVRLSLYRGPATPYSGAPVPRLTVGPGQVFTVDLVEKLDDCSPPPNLKTAAATDRYFSSPENHVTDVPAVVTVSTPLGTRTVGTTFTFSCSV
jgi:hypothetical protein